MSSGRERLLIEGEGDVCSHISNVFFQFLKAKLEWIFLVILGLMAALGLMTILDLMGLDMLVLPKVPCADSAILLFRSICPLAILLHFSMRGTHQTGHKSILDDQSNLLEGHLPSP